MNWIKCSDRLPDDGVCVIGFNEDIYMRTVYFNERNNCFEDGNSWVENITHWMPLPEPPTE